MIETQTVLILGAGSNTEYGFPTGAKLRSRILDGSVFTDLHDLGHSKTEYKKFTERFGGSQMPTIDEFLENNVREFGEIGTRAIASVIMRLEDPDKLVRKEGTWYDHLWDVLRKNLNRFKEQKLSIVTFNYDRSLEWHLSQAMRYAYGCTPEAIRTYLEHLSFIHVYGALGGRPYLDENYVETHGHQRRQYTHQTSPDEVRAYAPSISLINRKNPTDTTPELTEARRMIEAADRIYFLGFGYDDTNLERLGWPDVVRPDAEIFGTAYRTYGTDLRDVERNLGLGARPTLVDNDCLYLLVNKAPLEQ